MERKNITYNPGQYTVSPCVSLASESTFLSPPAFLLSRFTFLIVSVKELSFFPLSLVYLTGVVAGNSHGPRPLATDREGPQIGRGRVRIRSAETEFQNTVKLLLGLEQTSSYHPEDTLFGGPSPFFGSQCFLGSSCQCGWW